MVNKVIYVYNVCMSNALKHPFIIYFPSSVAHSHFDLTPGEQIMYSAYFLVSLSF